jgi:enoyl-CoA hydratase/carnithine racemase
MDDASYEHLIVKRDGDITTVTLDRPEKRNALAVDVMEELTVTLEAIGRTDARGVVLAANGPVFSAGHNFGDMAGATFDEARHVFDVCTRMMGAVQSIPQPVCARVHALATAAGCQLVAACDLAVASEAARFATPGVKIGLFCTTPMVEVARVVGRMRAMEMLLTGEPIDAATALSWGLVNRVVPHDHLDEAAGALARQVASASGETLALGKPAVAENLDLPLEEAYRHASAVMRRNAATADAQEGMTAFIGKRDPVWSHGRPPA